MILATPIDAQATVARYYHAIERHDYAAAYVLWDRNGAASGKRLGDFARGFARTAQVHAEIGAARDAEGAAGSSYITVPVIVIATLKNGTRQRFVGSYVLRAVDVDGATAAQRRWHISSATLRPA